MPQLRYAMRFTGRASPNGGDGSVLKAASTAPSSLIASTIGAHGLSGVIDAALGEEVTFTGETSFQEVGTIAFGAGNVLRFSTIGNGYLAACADLTCKHGAVVWHVDGGEGQFAGASGLITSNFFLGEQLDITDHHFGVLFVL